MFQAYTYYLYHIPTGKKYYGARWANKCSPQEDLWNEYFSSSELVEELIKEYGKESFVAEVRKTFDSKEATLLWEQDVITRIKAVQRKDWLNQTNNIGPYYCDQTGRKRSPESIERNRNARKGKTLNEQHKKNISLGLLGHIVTEEARIKSRNKQKGMPKPEETKKKMKLAQMGNKNALGHVVPEETRKSMGLVHLGTRWIYNIRSLKNKKIQKTDRVPEGWALGKKHKPKSIGLSVIQNTQEI